MFNSSTNLKSNCSSSSSTSSSSYSTLGLTAMNGSLWNYSVSNHQQQQQQQISSNNHTNFSLGFTLDENELVGQYSSLNVSSQQRPIATTNSTQQWTLSYPATIKRPLVKSKTFTYLPPQNEVKFQTRPRNFPFFKQYNPSEVFSKKVFVGGLPPDIDETQIYNHFSRFGQMRVDWPHKSESRSYFPPKGYAFLIYAQEKCVQELMSICTIHDGKYYTCVSSPSIKEKPVQIRPWLLSDTDCVVDMVACSNLRKTIFVGGVPRPIKACELAQIMNNLYGGVCYAGIDTDAELKYPKGAGRVSFSTRQSYIEAIHARFIHIQNGDVDKRVEIKPYVLDDQYCDECQEKRGEHKAAPYFCANVICLNYYCESCWFQVHSANGREFHKPLVKEGDRPRTLPFKRLNQL